MKCCSGSDWLWLWTASDGAVIPTSHPAFIKSEPLPVGHTLLPTSIECVFQVSELPSMPGRIRRGLLVVEVYIVPVDTFILVPIVGKVWMQILRFLTHAS